jgi:poly-beta-1,6-N-acetyl-D-glucosamine synthase
LILDLMTQETEVNYEVLFIDDHSNDKGVEIVQAYSKQFPLKSLHLGKDITGKKNALKLGAENAQYEILLFTDADCRVSKWWVSGMRSYFVKDTKLVCGPFLYITEVGFLNNFQIVEQCMLWFASMVAYIIKKPIMCNGANMAILKSEYLSVVDDIDKNTPSGDDMFLLQEMKKKHGDFIVFTDNPRVSTKSKSAENFKSFLNQKVRWASKASKYSDNSILVTGILYVTATAIFIYSLLFVDPKYFLNKCLVEYFCFMIVFTKYYERTFLDQLLKLFTFKAILTIIVYPFYSLLVMVLSKFSNFEWKGRKYERR